MSDHPHNTRFLSTLSLRRATASNRTEQQAQRISIHALLAESDLIFTARYPAIRIFLSTLSLRRATVTPMVTPPSYKYFYPRSPCGERHHKLSQWMYHSTISIHALLAESDGNTHGNTSFIQIFLSTLSLRRATNILGNLFYRRFYFYPRSPCGERLGTLRTVSVRKTFLSTLSLRRATR